MYKISMKKIDELQIILEDLRNHLTIIKGFIQISSGTKVKIDHEQILMDSVSKSDTLIGNAIKILESVQKTN
ncbi:hypothetical protein SAMN05660649_04652 [Desulfotomaculum arcticum]|uniref:Uncharacterized protein n=2 Tax=Desulfotruncus TaxID=2867377 RepID=A0A1I2YXD3_9FIRM|nr:hypothetical protein SAMN05660649_04652 [Desulfotomaculum arcticum] [Desulfotruncus arcticus DSM 17038]